VQLVSASDEPKKRKSACSLAMKKRKMRALDQSINLKNGPACGCRCAWSRLSHSAGSVQAEKIEKIPKNY